MEQKMHKRIPQVEEKSVLSALSSCRRRVGEKFQLLGRLSLGTQRFSRQRGWKHRRKFILQKSEQICQAAPDKILFA